MRKRLYVSLFGDNAVAIISDGDFKEERRIYVERPGRLRISDSAVYGAYADGVFALAPDSGELLFTAYAGAGACDVRVTSDGSRAFALCADADAVSVLGIDGPQSGLLHSMPTGGYPRSMDLSADEDRLVVACAGSCSFMLCNTDSLSLMCHRMVRGVPCYAVFCENYIICSVAVGDYRQEGRLCIFDGFLDRLFNELYIPGTPTTILPLGDTVLVGYIGGIMLIDVKSGKQIWNKKSIGFPDALCMNGDCFIVADLFENTLHIMSSSGQLLSKLDVGPEPAGIVVAGT